MFENLTQHMNLALRKLRGIAKLTENNIAPALKEVKTALLTADVHFKVARTFIERVQANCLGQKTLPTVTPGQQAIKALHDELVALLGKGSPTLSDKKPLRIMIVGLQGAGKTTTSVKLAKRLSTQEYTPSLIACDLQRPAAIDQLEILAQQEKLPVYADRTLKDAPQVAKKSLAWSEQQGSDCVLFDTAGRLHIDTPLIEELKTLKAMICPDEILLVVDSALGQEAVAIATRFHEALSLTGVILTKLDGDARGGAALSIKAATGVPIKFVGTGEKLDDLDPFHPDRMANRILGMGDVTSLVEKAREKMDKGVADKMAKKLRKADFNLEDLLTQIRQLKKMGSLNSMMKMLPGMSGMQVGSKEEKQMQHTEAIILSMTLRERRQPQILNGSRRLRIANGAGLKIHHVNGVLKQFTQMSKMAKKLKKGGNKPLSKKMAARLGPLAGGTGSFPGMPKF